MSGSSRSNQIFMAPKDKEFTAFYMPKDIYYYNVLPFDLNKVGVTHQIAMQNIFDELLHKILNDTRRI